MPEEAPYQHPAPQEAYYDLRACQQKQPVRYMPQETYQPDPRGAYPQAPQSYYTGPGADPYIVEYVEQYSVLEIFLSNRKGSPRLSHR